MPTAEIQRSIRSDNTLGYTMKTDDGAESGGGGEVVCTLPVGCFPVIVSASFLDKTKDLYLYLRVTQLEELIVHVSLLVA